MAQETVEYRTASRRWQAPVRGVLAASAPLHENSRRHLEWLSELPRGDSLRHEALPATERQANEARPPPLAVCTEGRHHPAIGHASSRLRPGGAAEGKGG